MSYTAPSIDFGRDGKQLSRLRIPRSSSESAWGGIAVPVGCIKHGIGPTLLATAGLHGDEYEGPIALNRLWHSLDAKELSGRLILLPCLNPMGLAAATRLDSLGMDPNRVFPGKEGGAPSERVAHFLTNKLLPLADVVIDFHSGGRSLDFVPSIIAHHLSDQAMFEKTLAAARCFGAPYGMVLSELDAPGTWDTAVESSGTLFLTTELRGGARATASAADIAYAGMRALLGHLGMTHDKGGPPTGHILDVPDTSHYVLCATGGVFEPLVELEERVHAGQPVARIHQLERMDHPPLEIACEASGMVVALRSIGQCRKEDTLMVIGEDWSD